MNSKSTVSQRELRGYFILLVLFSTMNIFGPELIDWMWPVEKTEITLQSITMEEQNISSDTAEAPKMSPFDINAVSREELIAMGVNKQTAKTWIRFRTSMEGFQSVTDIEKIYGLSEETLNRIKPYAIIKNNSPKDSDRKQPHTASTEKRPKPSKTKTSDARDTSKTVADAHSKQSEHRSTIPDSFDLNAVSAAELQWLKGVGTVFSERIIKFRDALGGFHSVAQVADTYGLPPETYRYIRDKLYIGAGIKQLDLNNSSKEQLAGHPYISWEIAEWIIRFRRQNGSYNSVEALKKLHGLRTEEYNKIKAYLKVGVDETVAASGVSESK